MTCYMCENEATTSEHVPPRCLFPEKKDLPRGFDLRRSLITVPSCADHNTKKSADDEYFLNVLIISILGNNIALNHFSKKIIRSWKRNPSLFHDIYRDPKSLILKDISTGKAIRTTALFTDRERLDNIIKMLSRALHYYHFQEKWLDDLFIHCDFLISLDPIHAREDNEYFSSLARTEDILFFKQPYFGKNPEVFRYQLLVKDNHKIMRLHFYEGCKILVAFKLESLQFFLKSLTQFIETQMARWK